jgi:hypothetical protein
MHTFRTWSFVLVTTLCAGCSSAPAEETPTPLPDLVATWQTSALQNVDAATPGNEEVMNALVFSMEAADGPPQHPLGSSYQWEYSGKAKAVLALFTPTGGTDPEGLATVKIGANGSFAGPWVATPDDSGGAALDLSLPCESVMKVDPQSPAAICGQDGVPTDVGIHCQFTKGNTALACQFGGSTSYTFHRAQ